MDDQLLRHQKDRLLVLEAISVLFLFIGFWGTYFLIQKRSFVYFSLIMYLSEAKNMRLRELRIKSCLTQKKLAEMMNVSSQSILNWENGIFEPNLTQIVQLMDFLK